MVFSPLTAQGDIGILVLRVFAGSLLAKHGYPKLVDPEETKKWLAGLPIPVVFGPLIGVLELLGGVFLVIGFLTPVVGFLFMLQFIGIVFEGKRLGKKSFGDYEKDLFYLGTAVAFIFLGGGMYSVDRLLGL